MRIRIEEKIRTLATAWLHRMRLRSWARGSGSAGGRAGIPSWLPVSLCLVIIGVAMTLALLKQNAVVGVTGFFQSDSMTLQSMGTQCALCHSTVDDSLAFGIGHRLDGWANRDLNVGAIIANAPGIHALTKILSIAD